jgi:hypothetical protein
MLVTQSYPVPSLATYIWQFTSKLHISAGRNIKFHYGFSKETNTRIKLYICTALYLHFCTSIQGTLDPKIR